MKKYAKLLTLLVLLLSACEDDRKNDQIRFGVCADYPPFEYYVKGELTGFDVELAKAIAIKLKMNVEFGDMSFSAILAELQNGSIDAAVSCISSTAERKKNYDFTNAYYKESLAVMYKKNAPVISKEQMVDKKVACQLGSVPEKWLKKNATKSKITSLDKVDLAIEALKAGHVHCILVDSLIAKPYCETNQELGYTVIVKDVAESEGFSIALKKDSPLTKRINDVVTEMESSGELQELKEKWGLAK
ncbi:MAG: ABC transporter substrate-binding protein [Holosporales bacterium]|jgi:polar amino acid transport system substrate-binding protein|nr:ABC transporter substrate-binding protein [Holosporales bacterium]